MKKQTKKAVLALRFLRQGYLVEKKPEGFDEMDMDAKKAWADTAIEQKSDQELFKAMADYENTDIDGYFDSTPGVEAIEDTLKYPHSDYLIYSTTAWDAFTDPDYGENIIYENGQMGQYLEDLGFTQNNVTNIASGAPNSITKLEKLKALDNARSAALKDFRQEQGTKLIETIKNDDSAPQLLKELIKECNITYLGFDKVVSSSDYMPDHCVYLYLSGDILIGVQTKDKSDNWDETEYEYGDQEIIEEIHFHDVVNDNNLITREVTMEEGAEAYKYLMKLTEKLETEDREVFRDYLLERED